MKLIISFLNSSKKNNNLKNNNHNNNKMLIANNPSRYHKNGKKYKSLNNVLIFI